MSIFPTSHDTLHNENDNSFIHQLRVELVDGPPKEPRMSNMAWGIVKLLYEDNLQFVASLGIQRKGIVKTRIEKRNVSIGK